MEAQAVTALELRGAHKTFRPIRWPWRRHDPPPAPGESGETGEADGTKRAVDALVDLSLTVQRGQIYGLLGPNGSGKSTLIRVVSTLIIPDRGEVTVFGHDVLREERAVKRLINRVSVEASFFKKLSPMENLLFGARLYGLDGRTARERATTILRRLHLRERSLWEPMEQMSRGMQQKVAIARAFLTQPILLLLDEPTTGLDPRSKREVQALVTELRREHDATVLLTTHDMQEADELCDRVAIIDHGRIVADGTPAELKARVPVEGREATLEEVFMALTGHGLGEPQAAGDEA
ncbi:MAG: ABC transporter ATP-binding protein [Armatimonadetes bacterium]|nr:ABC transporter ATP-binding protein [Armatimonadota bacterium]